MSRLTAVFIHPYNTISHALSSTRATVQYTQYSYQGRMHCSCSKWLCTIHVCIVTKHWGYNNGGKAVKIMTTTKIVFLFFLQLRPYCRVNTDRAAEGAEFDSLCTPLFTYTPCRRNIQQGFLSSERVFYTLILDFHGQYRTLRSTGYSGIAALSVLILGMRQSHHRQSTC